MREGLTPATSNPAARRCDGKVAYRNLTVAERNAEQASARAGALVIAYQCLDCGSFHIGHADLAQRLAREAHVNRGCLECGAPIHEAKRQQARRWASPILYCSAACRRRAAIQRRSQQNGSQDQA